MRPGTKKCLSLFMVFLTVWLSLRLLFPLFSPFLLGLALALASEPMVRFLTRRMGIPRPVSAGIGVSMAFCFLAMVLMLLGAFALRELRSLAGILPDLEQAAKSGIRMAQDWALDLSTHAPASLEPFVRENVNAIFSDSTSLVDKGTGVLLSYAGNLLSHVPDSAFALGTGVISAFLFSAKLPRIRRWILRRIPRERLKALLAAGKRMKQALGGWLKAQFKLMGTTALILLLGFLLLRIPNPLLWTLGVALVDAFPVLGTGTVLLPWSLLCFLQQDTPRAIGLLGIYATITLTRSILEPKLVGRHLGLDSLSTLMALYAGYQLWGLMGMILAPLLAATALQLVPDRTS